MTSDWIRPLDQPTALLPLGVRLWMTDLTWQEGRGAELERLLSADEVAQADRFRSQPARATFVLVRAGLRLLLGDYLSLPPEALRFDYSPKGKPSLAPVTSELPLPFFNVSHSANLGLIAMSPDRAVGVDLERVQPRGELTELAKVCMTVSEREFVQASAPSARLRTFLQLWTRKEAILKASGEGITTQLTALDLSDSLTAHAAVPHQITFQSRQWQLYPLQLGPNYEGALGLEARPDPRLDSMVSLLTSRLL